MVVLSHDECWNASREGILKGRSEKSWVDNNEKTIRNVNTVNQDQSTEGKHKESTHKKLTINTYMPVQ